VGIEFQDNEDKEERGLDGEKRHNKPLKTRNGEASPLNGDAACNGNGDLPRSKDGVDNKKKGDDDGEDGMESGDKKGKVKGRR